MIRSLYKSGYRIERPAFTNEAGIEKKTYSEVTTISGRMRPLTGNEILANDKLGLKTTDRFYCDIVDIKEEDRIIDLNSGKIFEVKHPKNPMGMNHHLEVDCEFNRDFEVTLFVTASGDLFELASGDLLAVKS